VIDWRALSTACSVAAIGPITECRLSLGPLQEVRRADLQKWASGRGVGNRMASDVGVWCESALLAVGGSGNPPPTSGALP
jgi:hypothetical protein